MRAISPPPYTRRLRQSIVAIPTDETTTTLPKIFAPIPRPNPTRNILFEADNPRQNYCDEDSCSSVTIKIRGATITVRNGGGIDGKFITTTTTTTVTNEDNNHDDYAKSISVKEENEDGDSVFEDAVSLIAGENVAADDCCNDGNSGVTDTKESSQRQNGKTNEATTNVSETVVSYKVVEEEQDDTIEEKRESDATTTIAKSSVDSSTCKNAGGSVHSDVIVIDDDGNENNDRIESTAGYCELQR